MIPMPWVSPIRPALRNEMVITDTSELDCRILVETTPNDRLFQSLSVERARTRSSTPPENTLKPFSSDSIPNIKIATPAEIVLNSGLIQKPQPRMIKMTGKIVFLSMSRYYFLFVLYRIPGHLHTSYYKYSSNRSTCIRHKVLYRISLCSIYFVIINK